MEKCFQALGDPLRLRIIRLLVTTQEEACVCELTDSLLQPKDKLSKCLKHLREVGLLSSEKEGRWVYHRLVDSSPFLNSLFTLIATMEDREGIFAEDATRFQARLDYREDGRCRVGSPVRLAARLAVGLTY